MTRYLKSLLIASLLVVGFASSALALNDEMVFSQFQFNFLTPGARATALGGAFIGSASDATAVESNPAGLTQLVEPEVSIELKHIGYKAEYPYENYSGATDVTKKDFVNSIESIPFVSGVFPLAWKDMKFAFSIYRQELVNYESSFRTSQYPIAIPGLNYWGNYLYPIDAAVDLTVTNYGIGAAVRFPFLEGLSFAISPRWSEMKMTAHTTRYCDGYTIESGCPNDPFLASTDFSEGDILYNTKIDDSDSSFSVNVGLLWELSQKISFGAVYRNGPKFEVANTFDYRTLTHFYVTANSWEDVSNFAKFTLKVPDSFGAGVKFAASKSLTLTLDVVHIKYKDLLEDFDTWSPTEKDNFTIDNATEVHLGVEYLTKLGERPLALRIGGYYDPAHTIKYTGDEESYKIFFPGGDAQVHVTGGVGFVVNQHFKIDTAANLANTSKQMSVSAVYSF